MIMLPDNSFSIMPGGVPHWVLGTANAMCVGRHFYAASAIRSTVIAIVHTFLLATSVTNGDYNGTRTLLYQLLVFWSLRLDKTDVDGWFFFPKIEFCSNIFLGAHIPDMSLAEEFLDVLYLGVFVIISSAFDLRFYSLPKPSPTIKDEIAHAVRHFQMLLHVFSLRFYLVLDGQAVSHLYVVDRLLAEFAAASVVLAKGVQGDAEVGEGISLSSFSKQVEESLANSHPQAFPYFLRCLNSGHKNFVWTGPRLQILPRSEDFVSLISGELMDLPTHSIYTVDLESQTPSSLPVSTKAPLPAVRKRLERGLDPDHQDERQTKRRR